MKHILIVEDGVEHAFIIQSQLNKLHFLTSVCVNPFQVLQRIRDNTVDAVTVDIGMPEINGIELIKYIRAIDKNILVVVITAFKDDATRIESMQAGANYFLVKPVAMDDMRTIFKMLKD